MRCSKPDFLCLTTVACTKTLAGNFVNGQTRTETGVPLCSGASLHLPDWQRDDLCSKHQVDRLQQQRSVLCVILSCFFFMQTLICSHVFFQVITHTSPHWQMCRRTSWSTCTCSVGQWSSTMTTISSGQRPTWTLW